MNREAGGNRDTGGRAAKELVTVFFSASEVYKETKNRTGRKGDKMKTKQGQDSGESLGTVFKDLGSELHPHCDKRTLQVKHTH